MDVKSNARSEQNRMKQSHANDVKNKLKHGLDKTAHGTNQCAVIEMATFERDTDNPAVFTRMEDVGTLTPVTWICDRSYEMWPMGVSVSPEMSGMAMDVRSLIKMGRATCRHFSGANDNKPPAHTQALCLSKQPENRGSVRQRKQPTPSK